MKNISEINLPAALEELSELTECNAHWRHILRLTEIFGLEELETEMKNLI